MRRKCRQGPREREGHVSGLRGRSLQGTVSAAAAIIWLLGASVDLIDPPRRLKHDTFFRTRPNAAFRPMHSLKRKFETLHLPNSQTPNAVHAHAQVNKNRQAVSEPRLELNILSAAPVVPGRRLPATHQCTSRDVKWTSQRFRIAGFGTAWRFRASRGTRIAGLESRI